MNYVRQIVELGGRIYGPSIPATPPTPPPLPHATRLDEEVQQIYQAIDRGVLDAARNAFGDRAVCDLGKIIEALYKGRDPSSIHVKEKRSWIADAVLGVKRAMNAPKTLDESKQNALVFLNTINLEIQGLYGPIDQRLLTQALDRFGPVAIRDLAKLVDVGHDLFAGGGAPVNNVVSKLFSAGRAFVADNLVDRATLRAKTLNFLLGVANIASSALPDSVSKKKFADEMAVELESALLQIASAQERAKKTKAKTQALRVQALDQALGSAIPNKDLFYDRLAERVRVRYEKDLLANVPALLSVLGTFTHESKRREPIKQLLLKVHTTLTDPIFLKKIMAEFVLTSSSQAMERVFKQYMKGLESPQSTQGAPTAHHPAYGKAVFSLIDSFNPIFFSNIYRFLFGRKKIEAGSDPLSSLLSDLIDSLLEKEMQPPTDDWLSGLIPVLRLNLLDASDLLNTCPSYILTEDWKTMEFCCPDDISALIWEGMSLEQRRADATSEARVEVYKKLYEKKVEVKFFNACQRIGKEAARCGLVFEQFLQTARQAANDSRRFWITRAIAYIFACILAVPGLNILFEILHRITIFLRSKLANSIGNVAGKQLATEMSVLFESQAMDLLLMKLVEQGLEKLNLIDSSNPLSRRASMSAPAGVASPDLPGSGSTSAPAGFASPILPSSGSASSSTGVVPVVSALPASLSAPVAANLAPLPEPITPVALAPQGGGADSLPRAPKPSRLGRVTDAVKWVFRWKKKADELPEPSAPLGDLAATTSSQSASTSVGGAGSGTSGGSASSS